MKPRRFEGYVTGTDGLQRKTLSFGRERVTLVRDQHGTLVATQLLTLRQIKETHNAH